MVKIDKIMENKKYLGFTLIELLVVISVIGILVALAMFGMQNSYKSARDTQRKSDLKQYQTSLEAFANGSNGLYPRQSSTVRADTILCANLGLSGCPADPVNQDIFFYYYRTEVCGSNNDDICATTYYLRVRMETETSFWVVCSNGKSGAVPTSTVFTNNCPLS